MRLQELRTPSPKLVVYHFGKNDEVAETVIRLLLNEARPSVDLGRGRRILFHKAHVPQGQDHLHFVVRGHKVAALNKDGTAHDQSHGVQLQRWAIDGASEHYAEFKMPKNGIIEQLFRVPSGILLNEGFASDGFRLTRRELAEAEARAEDELKKRALIENVKARLKKKI